MGVGSTSAQDRVFVLSHFSAFMLASVDADILPRLLCSAALKHLDLQVSVHAPGHSLLVQSMVWFQWVPTLTAPPNRKNRALIQSAPQKNPVLEFS